MDILELREGNLPFLKIDGVKNFDIAKIFDCGQCFRFDPVLESRHEKEFSGVAYGRLVSFAQDADTVYIYGSDRKDFEEIWAKYLDIHRDYDDVAKDILSCCANSTLAEAVNYGEGIRILAQEPFECIISFIISQNNNIPRIKKIIEALCLKLGAPVLMPAEMANHLSGRSSLCAFPDADAIIDLGIDGLFELKTGFRAKYIYDAASKYLDGSLSIEDIMREDDIEKAIESLCLVKGIGRKVACCALLFGFAKYNAFPVDVWIKRVVAKYFGDQGEDLSWKTFGDYAGIAQQYLFYYERYRSLSEAN